MQMHVVLICLIFEIMATGWNVAILGNVWCFVKAENSILIDIIGIQMLLWKIFNQCNAWEIGNIAIKLLHTIALIKILILDVSL